MRAIVVGVVFAVANADCGWVHTCGPRGCPDCKDDGSPGYKECCGGTPPAPPGPTPAPGPLTEYCPSKDDLVVAYGSPDLQDGGWHIKGDNGAATKSAFNLLGGYVEFTYDVSKANTGVNTNIYTISPTISGAFFVKNNDYCDGAINDSPWCMEDDWVESNGNCGGATTLHTVTGPGQFCGAWGCRAEYHYNGATNLKWRVEYDTAGHMTVKRGDEAVSPGSLNPAAKDSDWDVVVQTMQSKGVVIYSSQWGNWVPVDSCGPAAHEPSSAVDNSEFTISGLKIVGTVVQGPEPRKCQVSPTPAPPAPTPSPTPPAPPAPTPPPTPPAPPAPTPSPAPGAPNCPGGTAQACIGYCPASPVVAKDVCNGECMSRCEGGGKCTGGDDGDDLAHCFHNCASSNFKSCVSCCTDKFPEEDAVV